MRFSIYLNMRSRERLRSRFREKRNNLPHPDIDRLSLEVTNNCLQLPLWNYSIYHLFLTIERLKEINTQYLLQVLQGRDKNVVVSRSNFEDSSMRHFLLNDDTRLVENQYGIPEPQNGIELQPDSIELIFVPLLVADLHGNRLGYGKGFYDRFLESCRDNVIKVGLSLFEPIDQIPDIKDHDQKLDYLVTPERAYDFSAELE